MMWDRKDGARPPLVLLPPCQEQKSCLFRLGARVRGREAQKWRALLYQSHGGKNGGEAAGVTSALSVPGLGAWGKAPGGHSSSVQEPPGTGLLTRCWTVVIEKEETWASGAV